jgi:hypothetical protein
VRTTGRTSLAQGNLVVTRPVHASDGRDTAAVLATLQAVEWETPTCIDTLRVLIPGVLFTTSRISSSTSGVVYLGHPLLATRGAKFPCSQRRRWIHTNVFLSGHLRPGYISWYKQWATTALPSAKLYMKHTLASSGLEYTVSTTCSHHTLTVHFSYLDCVGLYHDCLNVVNDGKHLRELRNSVYHSAVLESLNSETMHFRTNVDINYFYHLHMRNSFLKLWRVFLKHPVYYYMAKPKICLFKKWEIWKTSLYTQTVKKSHDEIFAKLMVRHYVKLGNQDISRVTFLKTLKITIFKNEM